MMDEMRIKLSTKFMRGIFAKLLSKAIQMKTGCKVDIQIHEFDFWSISGDTTIKTNVEVKLKSEEFNKILKSIDLD
jgi:hypothetical protein